MTEDDLAIGDLVQRASFPGEPTRRGTVADTYQSSAGALGETVPLYAVYWEDSNYTERGYLRVGLIRCSVQGE